MKKIKAMLAAVMMLTAVAGYAPVTATAEGGKYDGYYVIRNVNSGMYMSAGAPEMNGFSTIQWTTDAAVSHVTWQVEEVDEGYYTFRSMITETLLATKKGDKVVTVSYPAGDYAADDQQFELSANADGSFKILSKNDGQAVEVANASTEAFASVQMWEVNGFNCQDWELIPVEWELGDKETPCTVTGGDDFTPGDLNDDGVVDVFDLGLAKRVLLYGGTEHQKHAADVDGSTDVEALDLVKINYFLHTGKADFNPVSVASDRSYAAIDGSFTNGFVESDHPGFTKDAYLNLYNEVGSSVTLNVNASEAGIYAMNVHYANGGKADRTVNVSVSRSLSTYTLTGAPTADWDTWETETIYIPLRKGMNTITLTSATADGAANLDSISFTRSNEKASPSTPIPPIKGVPGAIGGGKNVWGQGIRMEYLSRGLTAANTGKGMLLTWRILATDADNTSFKLYKNGSLLTEVAAGAASNYLDASGTAADTYTIDTYFGKTCVEKGSPALVFGTKNSGQSGAYFDIPTQKPADQTMPDGSTCSYTENDCSVGDIDGDGVYEIFVKWDPSNSQDNSKGGYTGSVFIDCYRLDGTMVWRVDLGKNIRAGAHYTQFAVYDFDGDGKAEMICKTADGTKDGKGKVIGDGTKDYRNSDGRVLSGPEYITLFDGQTGAALDTQNYDPARGTVADWGDGYGNRVDRFNCCVAYLDGQNPTAIFQRGYYTRMAVAAWDVKGKKLSKRWTFDTGNNKSTAGYGDGNHQIMGADVDGDGRQEVVCGSAVIDDNGKLLYTTGNAHGDAMHIGDFDPANPGLEIFQCLEDETHPNGKKINFGVELRDAKTGKALFRETAGGDTGRAVCDNLIPGNGGAEMVGSHSGNVYGATGSHEVVCQWSDITMWGQNSVVYWTDTLERAVLDRTMADQYGKGRVFTGDGVSYNNYTKSNACITCDLTGDWREEMIFRKSDGGLRVFTTTFSTEYPVYSLMHNPQYRVQVAAQNTSYNQPPHTDYFLGTGFDLPTPPTVFDYTAAH